MWGSGRDSTRLDRATGPNGPHTQARPAPTGSTGRPDRQQPDSPHPRFGPTGPAPVLRGRRRPGCTVIRRTGQARGALVSVGRIVSDRQRRSTVLPLDFCLDFGGAVLPHGVRLFA